MQGKCILCRKNAFYVGKMLSEREKCVFHLAMSILSQKIALFNLICRFRTGKMRFELEKCNLRWESPFCIGKMRFTRKKCTFHRINTIRNCIFDLPFKLFCTSSLPDGVYIFKTQSTRGEKITKQVVVIN